MSSLSRDRDVTQGPAVQMEGGQDMTSTINKAGQTVDDTRMSLEEIEALRKDSAASVAAKSAANAESEADFNRRKGYADQLGRINRQLSLKEQRAAALSAAYAALEAGVNEAFVRQGLRSMNHRETKEDRINRRQAEEKAEQELLNARREIAEANKKLREEASAASKARTAERAAARKAKDAAKDQKKGIPPKEKTDPLNLGVEVDADPKTTPPVSQEEGYDAKGNPIQPAPGRDIGTPTVRDRLEDAGVSGSKNPFPEMGNREPTRRERMEGMTAEEIVAAFPDMDMTRARMFKQRQAKYDPVGAGVDMTPIDPDREDYLMLTDMFNFGPDPRALTPSEMLDINLKDRVGSKAPGAVGSAPDVIDSLGFTAPSGNGFGDPAAAVAAQPPERPGLIDRAREGVQNIQGKFRSGQAAQRQMMSGITDQVGTFDIDETLDNLQTEFDDLSKKKKVMDLQGKVQGLQKDLAKGQRGGGVPVDHGFRQSFEQNLRQTLRDLLGID